jgi:hypothetical protein
LRDIRRHEEGRAAGGPDFLFRLLSAFNPACGKDNACPSIGKKACGSSADAGASTGYEDHFSRHGIGHDCSSHLLSAEHHGRPAERLKPPADVHLRVAFAAEVEGAGFVCLGMIPFKYAKL